MARPGTRATLLMYTFIGLYVILVTDIVAATWQLGLLAVVVITPVLVGTVLAFIGCGHPAKRAAGVWWACCVAVLATVGAAIYYSGLRVSEQILLGVPLLSLISAGSRWTAINFIPRYNRSDDLDIDMELNIT